MDMWLALVESAFICSFYCRYNDPACVKLLKLDILTYIANVENVNEAVEEIAEYVTDLDTSVARGAVIAIGKMGVKVPSCSGAVVEQVRTQFVCEDQSIALRQP